MAEVFEAPRKSRREEILRTALGLFLKKGFDGTPTSEIAAAVGTSKANVYHHFRAKDDLLRALVDPLFEQVEQLVDREPEKEKLLEEYLEIMLENHELVAFLGNDLAVLSRPQIGERAARIHDRLLALVAGPEAGLAELVRAEHALGGMRAAVVRFSEISEADLKTVRETSLQAAKTALTF
ncbi:MAG: helix-turn-helix domain-containing protein [Rubrobacteraceae bacterium]